MKWPKLVIWIALPRWTFATHMLSPIGFDAPRSSNALTFDLKDEDVGFTLWFFNSSLWKPGPIKKSMMKMMIYRTYPLVNYTIDPEHQQFFVETNLPTHQVRRLLRNPRISMEAFFWIYGWLSIAMLDCRRVKELFRLVEWSLETPWILLPFHS